MPLPESTPAFDGSAARRLGTAGPSAPAEPAERRRSERWTEQATAWLSNAVGGDMTNGCTVGVADLSLHGVGFISTRPCRVGERHWILITRGPMRLSTRVRIASVRETESGRWLVGGEFF